MAAGGTAPFAVQDDASRGRQHAEVAAEDLAPFELDRRRVLQSSAFRRLQYKTQVFVAAEQDHFRTRLTHTLEVASQARQLAAALHVNVTLAEVIALAHDLGHPPFGHAGERALDRTMSGSGGFEHNAQSLRVVEYLEHPFPPFRGLNLSFEVREALARHHTAYDQPRATPSTDPLLSQELAGVACATIEAQLVAVADRLAYDAHDLEDALGAGLLAPADLEGIELWSRASADARRRWPAVSVYALWRPVIDGLQHRLRADVAATTLRRVRDGHMNSPESVRRAGQAAVSFSPEARAEIEELEAFLVAKVYGHASVQAADAAAADKVLGLFQAYLDRPDALPERFASRIPEQGLPRVVCDYVAGMTDRFCEGECRRLGL
jgi:dGTPase